MSRFLENSASNTLRMDLEYCERRIHHALDNYGVDMEDELKEALERLQKATEEVLECIRL